MLEANPVLAGSALDESTLRDACALPDYNFDLLRFVKNTVDNGQIHSWRPAAGTFPGWPKAVSAITMLDPCCGSGHFLTEALRILASLRLHEERLTPPDAVAAVLRDNLYGLEIDGRCVQIAAFAVALTAWRIGDWQPLPLPHIAWVGAPPPLPKVDFIALADGDADLERALAALHDLFMQAPVLGSLLETTGGDLIDPLRIANVETLLDQLLKKARKAEPEQMEGAIAARGMADAVALLSKQYTIQATNVPYLGRGKQDTCLANYIDTRFHDARADLSTAMIARMRSLAARGGTISAVTPQNWLFLGSYKTMRGSLITQTELTLICDLGPAAFNDMNWWAARTALIALTESAPYSKHCYSALDADTGRDLARKPARLLETDVKLLRQDNVGKDTDRRILINEANSGVLLSQYAESFVGFQNGDTPRWVNQFWEHPSQSHGWSYFQLTSDETSHYDGRHSVIRWEDGKGELASSEQAYVKGKEAWGKSGVIVRQTRHLPAGLYVGDMYDQSNSAIIPKDSTNLPAITAFVMSEQYHSEVRKISPAVVVTNATFVKVPFDLNYWKAFASERYPLGLPEPESDHPTQWLFSGHPADAATGTALHVALARLCGYRWPAETDESMRLCDDSRRWISKVVKLPTGDGDGLVSLPSVAGETSLPERLRRYLAAAFGAEWSDTLERRLVYEADELLDKGPPKDTSLEAWSRDRAFHQHCGLFHHRPFIWQLWDGLADGFSVFVHYHRFDQAALRKLTYTMLGDWLARAKAENNELRYEKGRELQQKLEKILEGEKPLDIFVRWKSSAEQPLGWDPDLDDGVRMNIRPFVEAGVLRDTPKIKWTKDRGADTPSAPWYPVFKGERINDHHTKLSEKRDARGETKKSAGGKS